MSRIGIIVYGYAQAAPQAARWRFQIDDGPFEELFLEPNTECKAIKDRQGLKIGKHRVALMPLSTSFVLTKFRHA